MNQQELFKELIFTKNECLILSVDHWRQYELFTWGWWLFIGLSFIPWLIWWKFIHKNRLLEILFYGLLVSAIAVVLDIMGTQMHLWAYPIRVIPFTPKLFPFDLTIMPVGYMVIYQYYTRWKRFLKATFVLAVLYAYVSEPILVWMDLYILYKWRFTYSFPLYIIIAIICKWLIHKLMHVQSKGNP